MLKWQQGDFNVASSNCNVIKFLKVPFFTSFDICLCPVGLRHARPAWARYVPVDLEILLEYVPDGVPQVVVDVFVVVVGGGARVHQRRGARTRSGLHVEHHLTTCAIRWFFFTFTIFRQIAALTLVVVPVKAGDAGPL